MKTLISAAIRCSLMFTAVAALSIVYPASVQAVPTTYVYTGNPFTTVHGDYTTNDFVTVMLTLADPLGPNFYGNITPIAFTFSDGEQTISNLTFPVGAVFNVATGATGNITLWYMVAAQESVDHEIFTNRLTSGNSAAGDGGAINILYEGLIFGSPGTWIGNTYLNSLIDSAVGRRIVSESA
jgi:hypothetical protein